MKANAAFLLLLCVVPTLSPAEPRVHSRELGANHFELEAQLAASTAPDEAQALLQPYAKQLCHDAAVHLGRYRFESDAPVGSDPATATQTFVQEMTCGGEAPAAPAVAPAPSTPPTADDERHVRDLTLAYLSAKDGNDFDAAFAMVAEENRQFMREDNWRPPRWAFKVAGGTPTRRDVVRITWYDNPAGAPPGRYVAADFRGDYQHAGFYCGYVMWIRQADGSYLILREEEGQLSPGDAARIPPTDLASVRNQLGCRD
jgi:cytochrome c551/c552